MWTSACAEPDAEDAESSKNSVTPEDDEDSQKGSESSNKDSEDEDSSSSESETEESNGSEESSDDDSESSTEPDDETSDDDSTSDESSDENTESMSDDSSSSEDDSTSDPNYPDDIPYCEPFAVWKKTWVEMEVEVLELVNEHRMAGANCGSKGQFNPAPALEIHPNLTCAARAHSKDMADRDFFDHNNPEGETPSDRIKKAQYVGRITGENIAAGMSTASATVKQWMESDPHCASVMHPDFRYLGVGYAPGSQYRHVWTQTFGG